MDLGYESVFRREIDGVKRFDLTIKTSDDVNFVKNIEVKQVISPNSSRIAENIRNGFEQLAGEGGGTIALYDANHNQSQDRISFIVQKMVKTLHFQCSDFQFLKMFG